MSASVEWKRKDPVDPECPIISGVGLNGDNIQGSLNLIKPTPYSSGKKVTIHESPDETE